ncbi:MAG: hypothetical protein A4E56_01433 [Pelotomaculum sp. PtaU1.Bin065]|nr:MAG: hypothetical protein A4E56_01433 [Pelotomaculum sp. PtaU1.Bin065]
MFFIFLLYPFCTYSKKCLIAGQLTAKRGEKMARPALAVMARVPSAEGKSRLKELLKPEQREQLQWAFLLDTLDKIKRLPGFACFVAAAPAARAGKLKAAVGPEVEVLLP